MDFNMSKHDIMSSVEKCKTSTSSCIIIDDLEGILSWNDIHLTYDNSVYQLVRNTCKTFIKEDQSLVVISNVNHGELIKNINLKSVFNYIMEIKN